MITFAAIVIINILLFIVASFIYLLVHLEITIVWNFYERSFVTIIGGNLDSKLKSLQWEKGDCQVKYKTKLGTVILDYLQLSNNLKE
jgi:hypothetical protein